MLILGQFKKLSQNQTNREMKERIVYIAHPLTGKIKKGTRQIISKTETQKNIKRVEAICKKIHSLEIIPMAPYLATLQYLDNTNFLQISLAIRVNQLFFEKKFMDEVWLFGDKISSGMWQEIEWAHEHKIPVIPKTEETKTLYKARCRSFFI